MTKPTGRPPGRPKTKAYATLQARIPQELVDSSKQYATKHNLSISELLRDGLEARLQRKAETQIASSASIINTEDEWCRGHSPSVLMQSFFSSQGVPMAVAVIDHETLLEQQTGAILWIDPQMAEYYLSKNSCNRPLNQAQVQKLTEQILDGDFDIPNGEPIIFADDESMIDGQHRCTAILKSQRTIPLWVISGVPSAKRSFVDSGMKRTLAHNLTMRNEKDASVLAAALIWLHAYERGVIATLGNTRAFTSNEQAFTFLEQHPLLRTSVAVARTMYPLLIPSVGAFLHYLFVQKDAQLATRFAEGIGHGVTEIECQPLYAFRERLIREGKNRRGIANLEKCVFGIKTWNAIRSGRTLRVLKWSRGEENVEPFPDPI